jgi:hypothetical protein
MTNSQDNWPEWLRAAKRLSDHYGTRRAPEGAPLAYVCLGAFVVWGSLFVAWAAWGEPSRHVWRGGDFHHEPPAWVELHAPTRPGAVASLTFENQMVHSANQTITLEWEGLRVEIDLEFQADGTQAERVIVTPPEGYIAAPRHLTVDEGRRETLHIYAMGVGS